MMIIHTTNTHRVNFEITTPTKEISKAEDLKIVEAGLRQL